MCLITNYNLYESKRYFCDKFAAALQRHGIIARILDVEKYDYYSWVMSHRHLQKPDLWCSFNRTEADAEGLYWWDKPKIPFLSFLIDPAIYDIDLIRSPYSILSCVDRQDIALLNKKGFDRAFFLPHAVERELAPSEHPERLYDVVFLGSCYDAEGLRSLWRTLYPKEMVDAFEEAAEKALSDRHLPFWQAVNDVAQRKGLELSKKQYRRLLRGVDNYVRGKDRETLIRSIQDAHIHIFGATCWRAEKPIKGWMQCLGHFKNVTIHPAVSFREGLEILKKSKICLNSMPFFTDGTHERIFTGLACGCLPITTDNPWVQENFRTEEELLVYRPPFWNEVNDKVNDLLAHENKRKAIVERGREKVMREHTWDRRVELLLEVLPPLLSKIGAS